MSTYQSLAGERTLSGVLIEDKYESPEHYTSCLFTLDGVTYRVDEAPGDGYRSNARDMEETDLPDLNQYAISVTAKYRDGNKEWHREDDVLELYNGDQRILEIGTTGTDDYYPSFVCNYTKPDLE